MPAPAEDFPLWYEGSRATCAIGNIRQNSVRYRLLEVLFRERRPLGAYDLMRILSQDLARRVTSLERFTGILLEHYAGRLPLWLAPVQAVVTGITSDTDSYVEEILRLLSRSGFRVSADRRNEKIGYKIREHSHAKVPLLLIVGKREVRERSVSVRRLGSETTSTVALDDLAGWMAEEARAP